MYADHLCYFRCLVQYWGCGLKNLERKTQELASTYLATLEHPESFAGVRLRDLHALDNLFGIHTLVYALGEDGKVELVLRPTDILSKRESQLHQAPGQIQSMLYLSAMRCLVSQSLSSPATQAKLRSQSQASLPQRSVSPFLDHLGKDRRKEGIAVPPELKYSQYRATFDIEVYYPGDGTNLPEKRDKLKYTTEQLLSISVASNMPGYEEPQCFVVEEEGREAELQTVPLWSTWKESRSKPVSWNGNVLRHS